MKAAARRRLSGAKLIEVALTIGFMLIGPLCAATAQSGASWTQAELAQRAQAGVLLEYMAARIRANDGSTQEYVAADIGSGPLQSCDGATSFASLDLCEWANLLRGEGLIGARGCISSPKPFMYVISITWENAVLTTPAGANCDLHDVNRDQRHALLTVVRMAQDS
jgi:Tfp pilus assembly protein PilV